DLGEAAVEESDPATGKQFVALSALIDRHFDDLQTLATQQERRLAADGEAGCGRSPRPISRPRRRPRRRARPMTGSIRSTTTSTRRRRNWPSPTRPKATGGG